MGYLPLAVAVDRRTVTTMNGPQGPHASVCSPAIHGRDKPRATCRAAPA